jgi:hypothetical protein
MGHGPLEKKLLSQKVPWECNVKVGGFCRDREANGYLGRAIIKTLACTRQGPLFYLYLPI